MLEAYDTNGLAWPAYHWSPKCWWDIVPDLIANSEGVLCSMTMTSQAQLNTWHWCAMYWMMTCLRYTRGELEWPVQLDCQPSCKVVVRKEASYDHSMCWFHMPEACMYIDLSKWSFLGRKQYFRLSWSNILMFCNRLKYDMNPKRFGVYWFKTWLTTCPAAIAVLTLDTCKSYAIMCACFIIAATASPSRVGSSWRLFVKDWSWSWSSLTA